MRCSGSHAGLHARAACGAQRRCWRCWHCPVQPARPLAQLCSATPHPLQTEAGLWPGSGQRERFLCHLHRLRLRSQSLSPPLQLGRAHARPSGGGEPRCRGQPSPSESGLGKATQAPCDNPPLRAAPRSAHVKATRRSKHRGRPQEPHTSLPYARASAPATRAPSCAPGGTTSARRGLPLPAIARSAATCPPPRTRRQGSPQRWRSLCRVATASRGMPAPCEARRRQALRGWHRASFDALTCPAQRLRRHRPGRSCWNSMIL
mmetsp:Transcript_12424/g.52239  ORF Transcript_12424/g.52239 Transcript_12424/m.52239 type:complete len:262 (-) Transcript_12424:10292-11077(-)